METQKIYWILFFLFLGFLIKRLPLKEQLKSHLPPLLNKMIIYLCLPAFVLTIIPKIELQNKDLIYPLSHWFSLLCLVFLTLLFSKFFQLERKTTGCLLILIPLGNTSFLGYPMVEVFFHQTQLPYAILYDQLGSFLGLALYAPFILSLYNSGQKHSPRSFFFNVLSFPPLLALLASLFFKEGLLSGPTQNFLTILSKGIAPLAMIVVGLQFKIPTRGHALPLTLGLSLKMIVAPLLTLLFFKTLGNIGPSEKVVVFQSSMPPMITAALLAYDKGLQKELAINLMGFGLIMAFILLPFYVYLLNS